MKKKGLRVVIIAIAAVVLVTNGCMLFAGNVSKAPVLDQKEVQENVVSSVDYGGNVAWVENEKVDDEKILRLSATLNEEEAEAFKGTVTFKKTEIKTDKDTSSKKQKPSTKEEKVSYITINVKQSVNTLASKLDYQKDNGNYASTSAVVSHIDVSKRYKDTKRVLQFLKINTYRDVDEKQIDKYLADKGVFKGKAKAFINAAKQNNIDVIYLIAHAMLETGRGTSKLATGVTVNGKKYYNFWGIRAVDNNAVGGGSNHACAEGWDTIDNAIAGGANWIAKNYIHSEKYQQDTVYKMKFNYVVGYEWHSYATDIAWPDSIARIMASLYDTYNSNVTFEFEKVIYPN